MQQPVSVNFKLSTSVKMKYIRVIAFSSPLTSVYTESEEEISSVENMALW